MAAMSKVPVLWTDEEERRKEAEVADAGDDKGFLGGGGGDRLVEPEADEQVGAEADHLPEEEDLDEVVREDEPNMETVNSHMYAK